ncbi:hypothetical protein SAY87_016553 [Trapa incisa]|uniref:Uncharacterized protein n=1 Tax=Trapa incisa TaxID=236973 RepID=A0AAN7L681_9MYRT|nr:hypothetical protein SAY87_016553 [Trapa incisa]
MIKFILLLLENLDTSHSSDLIILSVLIFRQIAQISHVEVYFASPHHAISGRNSDWPPLLLLPISLPLLVDTLLCNFICFRFAHDCPMGKPSLEFAPCRSFLGFIR